MWAIGSPFQIIVSNKVIMRRSFFLLTLVICLFCSCSSRSGEIFPDKASKVVAALHDPDSRYVVVVAHRGDWRNFPENSIPAIESVIKMGVDVMELDLKLTKDSVLVLSHDQTLDRMTTGSGRISDYTYAQIQEFDLKTAHNVRKPGLKVPTLEEALKVCKGRIVVNVDQGYDYYDMVLEITEKLGMTEQVLIKGGKPLSEVKEKLSSHERNMMFMPVLDVNNASQKALFKDYIAPDEPQLAYEICFSTLDDNVKEVAKEILSDGSKIWVNTIWGSLCGGYEDDLAFESGDPKAVYTPILDLGTSIIQTDRPEFLIKYLESIGRR